MVFILPVLKELQDSIADYIYRYEVCSLFYKTNFLPAEWGGDMW